MRFGWLTLAHSPGPEQDHAAIDQQLEQAALTVRIGFAVIQMALRHPGRLAVQLALLDNLSRGRLDVRVGRGSLYNEYEFVGYGLRSDDARERAAEAIDVMTRPYQRPHPPIWRSVVTDRRWPRRGET